MAEQIYICTGGELTKQVVTTQLQSYQSGDLLVGADTGAITLIRLGFALDLAIGDFDSVSTEEQLFIKKNSRKLQTCDAINKDYTDTEMAFLWALEQQPKSITILGGLGTRMDHSLANIHMLTKATQRQIPCKIVNTYNIITLASPAQTLTIKKEEQYPYVSLIPLTMHVHGVTTAGFQYSLRDASLHLGDSLGISNHLLQKTGTLSIEEGLLLVIQSCD